MTFQELVTLITTVAAVAGTPAGIYFAAKNERQRQAEAFARERTAAKEDAETAAAREKAAAEVSAGREAIAAAKAIDAGRELLLSQVLALGSKFLRASKDDRKSLLEELAELGGRALLLPDESLRDTFSAFLERCHRLVYENDQNDQNDQKAERDAAQLFSQLCNDARVLLGQPSDRIRVSVG
jgi:hypothetical protein